MHPKRKGVSALFHPVLVGEAMRRATEQGGNFQKVRSIGVLASLLIGVIAFGAGMAQAREKKQKAPPGLAAQIRTLGKQLYGQEVDDAKPVTDKIQKLVVGHLNTWIANRSPDIVEVRHELEEAFSELEYPAVGTPAIFIAPWKNVELIGAGYTLGWSDIWRVNVLVIYENQNGRTREVTTTHFVPRTDLHYVILPPSASGDFRFLAYGWKLGMSHPRLTAVLYNFDGKKLQSEWNIEDLFDGKLTVSNNQLVIRYLNESEYVRETQLGHLPPRHERIYEITPQGLKLETERDVPYR